MKGYIALAVALEKYISEYKPRKWEKRIEEICHVPFLGFSKAKNLVNAFKKNSDIHDIIFLISTDPGMENFNKDYFIEAIISFFRNKEYKKYLDED